MVLAHEQVDLGLRSRGRTLAGARSVRESEARDPELHSLLQGPASQSSQEAPPTRKLRNIAGLLFKVNKTNNRKYFNYIYLCICVYALVCGVCVRTLVGMLSYTCTCTSILRHVCGGWRSTCGSQP